MQSLDSLLRSPAENFAAEIESNITEEKDKMYQLVAIMRQGHEIVVEKGYNPVEVEAAARRVSRDPRSVKRIELRDGDSSLSAIWDADWSNAR